MNVNLRAHFDGRVIVPDELVDLPVNKPLILQISLPFEKPDPALADAAFQRLMGLAVQGANISDESLRRENLY